MRAKTTPTERPLPEAAPKRARDACEDEADVRDDAGDAYAFKLLKLVLESMRPRSGTQQAWDDVKLLVSHWKDRFRDLEAKESGGAVARKTTKTSSADRKAKERLKDRVPAAAWNLVDDATPAEAKLLEPLVDKLGKADGRRELIELGGATMERAGDGDPDEIIAGESTQMPTAAKIDMHAGFEKDKPVVIIRLQTATHLNGKRGTIVSFDEADERYVVELGDEVEVRSEKVKRVRVKRGNLINEELLEAEFLSEASDLTLSQQLLSMMTAAGERRITPVLERGRERENCDA